ncbi:3'(2'),5'-bisphosphate nucleotidase CysQ [Epibacterium ulvae]|uniref:inositol monophosphatase family protein n=1 Tax=Epibacterium ulvae TaxID=1156985 RepID=UPI001BFC4CF5|nr:3'(2'),5'-bisphosphate nucleotidase CysQ [Epibacterium ulvae]MBT8153506.1 3'(2'),5'-bisphosphate nucleotidase CysQ [Epibacterium ulvae]
MPATDLSLLIEAAEKAGDIANRYHGPDAKRWDKPDGSGPVTEADLEVDAFLSGFLQEARPDYGWLSEETEDNDARLGKTHVFIVDPIDGTRSFAEGSRSWAHSLAVATDGEITAAAVFLPQRDLMFAAAKGCGATLNGNPVSVSCETDVAAARVLTARPAMDPKHWKNGQTPVFTREYRPSLAYRLASVAQGRFDAMLTLRPSWEWDIAAGDLLIREADGHCSDRTGQMLRFNNPTPKLNGVLGANPQLHQKLLADLNPEGPGLAPL